MRAAVGVENGALRVGAHLHCAHLVGGVVRELRTQVKVHRNEVIVAADVAEQRFEFVGQALVSLGIVALIMEDDFVFVVDPDAVVGVGQSSDCSQKSRE